MLSLIITTHAPYLRYLPALIEAVEAQRAELVEVILAIDSADIPAGIPASWQVISQAWGNPQAARTAALRCVTQEWVTYLDGDNLPPVDSFRLMREAASAAHYTVGILYGDVLRVTTDTHAQRVFIMPEWSLNAAQEKSIVDTGSVWRTEALREAGGWPERSQVLNDYTTALAVMRLGWKGRKVQGLVRVLRHHDERRSLLLASAQAESLWECRQHALVTLFAGHRGAAFDQLMQWYKQAELPPNSAIVWVDNSRDPACQQALWQKAGELLRARRDVLDIRILTDKSAPNTQAADWTWEKHRHVGTLYNRVLASLHCEIAVTIEDDVIPPLDGIRQLAKHILPWGSVAAVSGVYASRDAPECCVASFGIDKWVRIPTADLPDADYMPVGMVGGGFTAWNLPALKQHALPLRRLTEPVSFGWDGAVCRTLTLAGYSMELSLRTRCAHLTS